MRLLAVITDQRAQIEAVQVSDNSDDRQDDPAQTSEQPSKGRSWRKLWLAS